MKLILTLFLTCIMVIELFAGITGKIVGTIVDSETKESLPGVNVYLEGSQFGAATDMDGIFFIINVPAGNYTLMASLIGYSDVKIQDIRVNIDLTTRIDINLTEESISGETIIVLAKRELVVKDISNSQAVQQIEEIEILPVSTLNEALSIQAGIELATNGIIVRGGSVNETALLMDGFSLNDERDYNPYPSLSLAARGLVHFSA